MGPGPGNRGESKGVNDPDAFTADSSLGADARAFGAEAKKFLNPVRFATDAALTAAGVKPALDAAQMAGDYVGAESEAADQARAGTDPAAPRSRPEAAASPDATTGSKTGAVRAGSARGADALGKRFGVGGAGDLLRQSQSNGSARGDATEMAKGAKTGAHLGSKVGGPVGTAIGAAAGAGIQGLKTKNGRRMIVAGIALPVLGPFLVMAMIVTLLVLIIAPSSVSGAQSGTDQMAYEAAETDGIDPAAVVIYEEAGEQSGIPWEMLAALVDVAGNEANPEEVPAAHDRFLAAARKHDTPVGPYDLLLNQADETARRYGAPRMDASRMEDLRQSSAFVASTLAAILAERSPDVPSFDLSAGVVLTENTTDPYADSRLDYAPAPDGGAGSGAEPPLNPAAQHLKDAYLDALATLPVENAEGNAENVYTLAMMWYFGQPKACDTGALPPTANGPWTDPVVGPVTDPYGPRIHPLTGQSEIHDGTDLGAALGTPVHAASSGTANITPTDWGGPHEVTIDHGGGLQTVYEHMDSATITNGQTVQPGDVIGTVGAQGWATGPHLHFGVIQNGVSTDPVPWMQAHGVNLGVDPVGQVGSSPTGGTAPTTPTTPATDTGGTETGGSLPSTWSGTSAEGQTITLDQTQIGFAQTIVAKGAEMGVPDDGVIIALMVAAQESTFRNWASDVYPETIGHEYPTGSVGSDHDSVGLFQQRPVSGWAGPDKDPMKLLDPGYAASAFFGGPQGPNHGSPMGLLDHPDWPSMSKNDAAQLVQGSGVPLAYAKWETPMTELFGLLKGTTPASDTCPTGMSGIVGNGFGLATLNLLGAGHTNGDRAGFDTWDARLPQEMALLDSAGVSVAGLQEAHGPQMNALATDPAYTDTWDIFPGSGPLQNAVIWRKSDWTLVSTQLVKIPYFHGDVAMPIVLLQQVASGQRAYFWSVHNPADARGPAAAKRAEALRIEAAKVTALKGSGLPVFLVGDFNDVRDSPRATCALAPVMDNAFGPNTPGECHAPAADAPVDHIFGTGPMSFSSPVVDTTTKQQRLSDHPLVYVTVASGGAQAAIDFALQQVGDAYVYGANGPDRWDCSSLQKAAWAEAGVTLPRTSREQATFGVAVDRADLQPGDLIFYYHPVSHVAMYIGERNGVPTIVHAANPHSGVLTAPLSEMAADIVGYRRVLSPS